MIFLQLSQQLQALHNLLLAISDHQFTTKITHLGNVSIGSHSRHIIELLQCAINGYPKGEVDYFYRTRNLDLETNRVLAIAVLKQLEMEVQLPDKQLVMVVEKTAGLAESPQVFTTYLREIVYNREHAIHHLALIKVALIELKLEITNKDFGMAYSTIQYLSSTVQG